MTHGEQYKRHRLYKGTYHVLELNNKNLLFGEKERKSVNQFKGRKGHWYCPNTFWELIGKEVPGIQDKKASKVPFCQKWGWRWEEKSCNENAADMLHI